MENYPEGPSTGIPVLQYDGANFLLWRQSIHLRLSGLTLFKTSFPATSLMAENFWVLNEDRFEAADDPDRLMYGNDSISKVQLNVARAQVIDLIVNKMDTKFHEENRCGFFASDPYVIMSTLVRKFNPE